MPLNKEIIEITETLEAHNYKPLPVALTKGDGIWVWDVEGNKYMDFLSSYSALNFGHCHPDIINALCDQAKKLTLTSKAFFNDKLTELYVLLKDITKKEMFLPMNTGAEAVETSIKAARRWGHNVKGIGENKAEIIVCDNNFHGRTTTIISFSSENTSRQGFGPYTPGFVSIPYNDTDALEKAVNENTCAFLVEPIQGEGGVIIPDDDYLAKVSEICRKNNILLIADEIQTGLGRTGKLFACDWYGVVPDIYILGKALGGGVYPVSMIAGDRKVLEVFTPGSHGSTFGGNPLGSAVACKALSILKEQKLYEKADKLGRYLMSKLAPLKNHPDVVDIRGKGLLIAIELNKPARPYCEKLKNAGLLCKETHDVVIRLAPPLIITEQEIDLAAAKIFSILNE